jgi:hypothetical protein
LEAKEFWGEDLALAQSIPADTPKQKEKKNSIFQPFLSKCENIKFLKIHAPSHKTKWADYCRHRVVLSINLNINVGAGVNKKNKAELPECK